MYLVFDWLNNWALWLAGGQEGGGFFFFRGPVGIMISFCAWNIFDAFLPAGVN